MRKQIVDRILVFVIILSLFGTSGILPAYAQTPDAGEEFAVLDGAGQQDSEITDDLSLTESADETEEIIDLDETEDIIDLDHPDESGSPALADEVKADETEGSAELKIKDGPEDIWEAIYALEESSGVTTPDEYKELLPQIEKIILSSPAYEEGTMEYEDGILFWWSDDRNNGYSPADRAKMNGYSKSKETSPEMDALYEEILEKMDELIGEEEGEITPAMAGTGYNVGVFLPYSGFSGDVFSGEEALAERIAYFTGGECTFYKGTSATIDELAALIQNSTVVIIGSHGIDPGGVFGITSSSGLTTDDYKDNHAWYFGKSQLADNHDLWAVDGTVISNHMTKDAGNCFVFLDNCMSMKTNRLCAPLKSRGVDVMLGFSESVSSSGAEVFASGFFTALGYRGDTVAEAFRFMKDAAGCEWDPLFHNLTLEQAQQACVAFPIIVSSEDDYPGEGNVNVIQEVKSTWKLPQRPPYDPTQSWTSEIITQGETITIKADLNITEKFKSVNRVSGYLPPGVSWKWNPSPGSLTFTGKPVYKGLYKADFKIVTTSGKEYTHSVRLMVKESSYTFSSETINFQAPDRGKWNWSRWLTKDQAYYQALNFPSDDSTYSMEVISGYLPYTLYCGFSDGSTGYIRSESSPTDSTKYYATFPGIYSATLEIVSYSGSVYHHTVQVNVHAANLYKMSGTLEYDLTQHKEAKMNLYQDWLLEDHTETTQWSASAVRDIKIAFGRLPAGMYLANSYEKPCGIYGTPTEWGTFSVTVDVYTNNDIYEYAIQLNITEQTLGQCGNNAYYNIIAGKELVISGTGAMWSFEEKDPDYYDERYNITSIIIQPGITKIGEYAFFDFTNLKTINIPSSLTSIGEYAFLDCEGLTSLSIPDTVLEIGNSAFDGCSKITSVRLPAKLKKISDRMFIGCYSLSSINIPDSVTAIEERAFGNCLELQSIQLGAGVKTIGKEAFVGCSDLTKIAFTGNAPKIAEDAFFNIVATATYQAARSGWTTSVRRDYGGEITWEGIGKINATSVKLDQSSAVIATENYLQLNAVMTPSNTTDNITWTSSDSTIASVDRTGWVSAKKYGKATITAKTSSGKTATCTVQTRFYDVLDSGSSYYKAVYWAVDKGITKCTVSFRPNDGVTRGEFTAFLYRLADSPKVTKYAANFKDVNSDTKFYKEISWAVNKGIIQGFKDKTFRPNDGLTRGQAAIMIWRYAGRPNVSTKTSPFKDVQAKDSDTCKAILWGYKNGIIKGYSDGTFKKDQACTRANVVTFLYRYKQKF